MEGWLLMAVAGGADARKWCRSIAKMRRPEKKERAIRVNRARVHRDAQFGWGLYKTTRRKRFICRDGRRSLRRIGVDLDAP